MTLAHDAVAGAGLRSWFGAPPVDVLLIEDTVFFRKFIESICARANWIRLHQAASLKDAEVALQRIQPSVVLLDLHLPDGNGFEWLLERPVPLDAAVVVLTADTSQPPDGMSALVQDYIVKSQIAPDQLLRSVRYAAERRRTEEAIRHRDEQARQAQKMEAIGRLAGGVAHDFSNLLTVITESCERMRDTLAADAPERGELDKITRNSARAASLIRQLLAFSRTQTLTTRAVDLGALLRSTAQLLEQVIGEHIALTLDIAPDMPSIEADPVQLEQVLLNLAINARDAMPRGGRLSMRLSHVGAPADGVAPGGGRVRLQVSDTGAGMTDEVKAHLFEPFFTTKGPQGTGLGLATVYGIVTQSGGHIEIESAEGLGATFNIYLPTCAKAPAVETPAPETVAPPADGTILLTEDEPDVRDMLSEMLKRQGYRVLASPSPAHALSFAESYEQRIDLLLTDVIMPGGTGPDLAVQLRASRPDLKVLFMSGYPEQIPADGTVRQPSQAFLAKPFTRVDLLDHIRQLIG